MVQSEILLPTREGGKLVRCPLDPKALVLVHHTPQMVLVSYTMGHLGSSSTRGSIVYFLNVHAKHGAHAAEGVKQWWNELGALVRMHVGSHPLILFGDLNSHFSDEACAAAGSHGATAKDNICGVCARAFCQEFGLFIPFHFRGFS